MNKLIPIAVAGLVVVGGGVFLLTRSDDSSKSTSTASSQSASSFDVQANDGVSYKATITTESNGKTVVNNIESDAKTGATRSSLNISGQNTTFIYTSDAYYMCLTADSCYKVPLGQGSGASFNPKDYQYGKAKIDGIKSTSKNLGRQKCQSGTCNVWEVTTDNYKTKVYVDTKTRLVTQAEGQTSAGTLKIVYTYTDVSVEIPANAQELPTGGIPSM